MQHSVQMLTTGAMVCRLCCCHSREHVLTCVAVGVLRRLQLLAEYQAGLLASLQLLGLAVPDLAACLEALKSLALTRAGLTQQEVRCRSICVLSCGGMWAFTRAYYATEA
jgi:hypothetical protein